MTSRPGSSLTLRAEVKSFCDAAETLASPALLSSPLTQDEREMIKFYLHTLDQIILTTPSLAGQK
jgi:hypothetical protein